MMVLIAFRPAWERQLAKFKIEYVRSFREIFIKIPYAGGIYFTWLDTIGMDGVP